MELDAVRDSHSSAWWKFSRLEIALSLLVLTILSLWHEVETGRMRFDLPEPASTAPVIDNGNESVSVSHSGSSSDRIPIPAGGVGLGSAASRPLRRWPAHSCKDSCIDEVAQLCCGNFTFACIASKTALLSSACSEFRSKDPNFFLEQLNEKDYVDAVRTLVRNSNSSNNSAPQSESSCISIEQTQCVRLNDSFVERVTSANLELCPHALLDQADKCTRNYAYDAMSSSHNTNVKAAFIFLLTDLRFYEMYLGAVDLFNRHVLSYMPYPVVVFYLRTDKFPFDEHMKVIRQRTLSSVEFAEMQNWHAPAVAEENMKSSLWRGNTCANSTWPIDYILMCRFFMGPVFTQPVMAKYDYYLRLDADLHIVAPFPFDPFEVMAKRDMDLLYWNADHAEHEGCVHDIRKTAMEYAKNTMKLLPCQLRNLERLHPHASIGGMFTGGSLAFFRSADYQQLANYLIDAMNGVYMHRWCDQNIYPIAAALLSSPEKWLRMGWKQGSCFAHKRQRPISDGPYDGDLRSIFDYDDSMKI